VLATLLAKLGFDLLIAGGDHFEYRVLSYLVPLLALAFLHGALSLFGPTRPRLAALALLGWAGISAILPWTHYARSHDRDAWPVSPPVIAIAGDVPPPLRPIAAAFDELQAWLIRHGVGVRHYEHRAFWLHQIRAYPSRELGTRACSASENPVAPVTTIGVAGWVLSTCHIIDLRGLTDHVIARAPVVGDRPGYMAHDRRPPLDYVKRFMPNVFVRDGRVVVYPRPVPLRDADIQRIEAEYW